MRGETTIKAKSRLEGLSYALESTGDTPSDYEAMVDAAVQFRDMLKGENISLSTAEKLQVLKSISRAKLRALRLGESDHYRTFQALDAVSSDLMQML